MFVKLYKSIELKVCFGFVNLMAFIFIHRIYYSSIFLMKGMNEANIQHKTNSLDKSIHFQIQAFIVRQCKNRIRNSDENEFYLIIKRSICNEENQESWSLVKEMLILICLADIQSSGIILLTLVYQHTAIRMNLDNSSLYTILIVTYLDIIHDVEYEYNSITWYIIDKRENLLQTFWWKRQQHTGGNQNIPMQFDRSFHQIWMIACPVRRKYTIFIPFSSGECIFPDRVLTFDRVTSYDSGDERDRLRNFAPIKWESR
jgi:hypothetical protein